jgi:hypothetical protein
MTANIAVFKRDVNRSRTSPPILSTAALMKILSLDHEFGQPRNAVGDAPRFVRCQVFKVRAEARPVQIIPCKDMRKPNSVSI